MLLAVRNEIDALTIFPMRVPGFLNATEISKFLGCLDRHEDKFGKIDGNQDYWKGRTLTPSDVPDQEVVQLFRDTRDRILEVVSGQLTEQLGPQPPLYADVVNFARWPVGFELHPHADAENPGGAPHPFPWRNFASVIYLNDNYGGGEIYFPNFKLELKPKPGTLVVFPGTLRYLHGVRAVTSGMRHTIASFLTYDATKEYRF